MTVCSGPDYFSFNASNDDEDVAQAIAVGEREKQRVLEAAGLIVNRNMCPAPLCLEGKDTQKAPACAALCCVSSIVMGPTALA